MNADHAPIVVELTDEFALVRLSGSVSLLEREGRNVVEQLLELALRTRAGAEVPSTIKAVLLLQEGKADDASPSWMEELARTLLLDELVGRCWRLRQLNTMIRESAVPWVYASASSTFGSYFELALACRRFFVFDSRSSVGFPDVVSGLFPAGGIFETLGGRGQRKIASWQAAPTLSIEEASERGLVQLGVGATKWRETMRRWLRQSLAQPPLEKIEREGDEHVVGSLSTSEQSSIEPNLVQIQATLVRWLSSSEDVSGAWNVSLNILKEIGKALKDGDAGELMSYYAARHYLSEDYRVYLERRLAEALTRFDARQKIEPDYAVWINLERFAPPGEPFARLLESQVAVVFFAEDKEALRRGLELVFSRLERARSSREAVRLWDQWVSWTIKAESEVKGVTLQWTPDDRVRASGDGQLIEHVRVAGNRGRAPCGICEQVVRNVSERDDDGEAALLAVMADGIVRTRMPAGLEMPLTFLVRSLLLEEIIRCGASLDDGPSGVVESLKSQGWGFLGSENEWERFLVIRHGGHSAPAPSIGVGGFALEAKIWEIGLWKEAKAFAKQLELNRPDHWSSPLLSQHFAVMCGILAETLADAKLVDSRPLADTLVAAATGFPAAYGSPTAYLSGRGGLRVERYVAERWPTLVRGTAQL